MHEQGLSAAEAADKLEPQDKKHKPRARKQQAAALAPLPQPITSMTVAMPIPMPMCHLPLAAVSPLPMQPLGYFPPRF